MSWHTSWRDCKAWADENLPLSTTSNQAAKMYDAVLTQLGGIYEDESMGGTQRCLSEMLSADPDFLLGNVLLAMVECLGPTGNLDEHRIAERREKLTRLKSLVTKRPNSERECKHVDALLAWTSGDMEKTIDIYEAILLEHPTDFLASKSVFECRLMTGSFLQMRDSSARILPHWKPGNPHYGYVHGVYAFGLEETHEYEKAKRHVNIATDYNKYDCWAMHTMAHVHDMTGEYREGIKYLENTEDLWADKCQGFSAHNYWHLALLHLEKGDFEGALGVYDTQIGIHMEKSYTCKLLDIADASTLLYRLQFEGVDVADRWTDVFEKSRTHTDDNFWPFYDAHVMLVCAASGRLQHATRMLDGLRNFANAEESDAKNYYLGITKLVGIPLCQALIDYESGDYRSVVRELYPRRYDIAKIGGSYSQVDVFNVLLINACLKSDDPKHGAMARALVMERKGWKTDTPLVERLSARLLSHHIS